MNGKSASEDAWQKAFRMMRVILPVSAASALCMALAAGTENYFWLAWIGLLPLFFLIRNLPPLTAALSGVVWGVSIFLLSIAGLGHSITPSLILFLMLAVMPGVYAALNSWLTRLIGFNPLVLAFSWILLEVSLESLGLKHGLLAVSDGEEMHLHWMCRLFGCASVAFLIACTNATILVLVVLSTSIVVGILCRKSWSGMPDFHVALFLISSSCLQLLERHTGSPRAPPHVMLFIR